MENFLKVIFILNFLQASIAFDCMQTISSNICIQTDYDPSIPDPNAKPPLVVNTYVEIVVSFFTFYVTKCSNGIL
jgi:hypothetical protein